MGLTNIELEKGGAREGGAVELRFACGGTAECGLCFGGRRRQSMLGFSDFAFMFFFWVLVIEEILLGFAFSGRDFFSNFIFKLNFFYLSNADVENCGSFKGFGYIYIIYIDNNTSDTYFYNI